MKELESLLKQARPELERCGEHKKILKDKIEQCIDAGDDEEILFVNYVPAVLVTIIILIFTLFSQPENRIGELDCFQSAYSLKHIKIDIPPLDIQKRKYIQVCDTAVQNSVWNRRKDMESIWE